MANTDLNNSVSFGNLYQWGRPADGHEKINSNLEISHSPTITPGHSKFIIETYINAYGDWSLADNIPSTGVERELRWQTPDVSGQVCPCGYIVATSSDFTNLTSEGVSLLKFPEGITRNDDGDVVPVAILYSRYWTSSNVSTLNEQSVAVFIDLSDNSVSPVGQNRMNGSAVRCIKPINIIN